MKKETKDAKEVATETKTNEQKPQSTVDQELTATVKEMEAALFAIKFYPVAVNEDAKNEAIEKLIKTYNKGNETIRQLLLYMVHENIATSSDLKIIHTYEYFKAKNPTLDPAQLRMNVYRAMFNYNTSLEGLTELIRLLGKLKSDDAAKLLTYHFSHLCSVENEGNHMLRAAIIESLGKSESQYALKALLEYAKYNDSERTFSRIVSALVEWDEKIDTLKVTQEEKEKLRAKLQEMMTKDLGGSHYG